MAAETYHGSCDCKKVRFEATFDVSKGTFKCNCTICWKGRFWGAMVQNADLKVTQGENELSKYGQRIIHHFCKHCGIQVFGRSAERAAVSLPTLDDLPPETLAAAPIRYVDGLHDRFTEEPPFKSLL